MIGVIHQTSEPTIIDRSEERYTWKTIEDIKQIIRELASGEREDDVRKIITLSEDTSAQEIALFKTRLRYLEKPLVTLHMKQTAPNELHLLLKRSND